MSTPSEMAVRRSGRAIKAPRQHTSPGQAVERPQHRIPARTIILFDMKVAFLGVVARLGASFCLILLFFLFLAFFYF